MRCILLTLLLASTTACLVHSSPPPARPPAAGPQRAGPPPGAPAGPAERRDDRHDRRFDRHSQWDKLGERWVDGRVDRDAVPVMRRERYHRIKLVVEHSAVELYDVVIVFGNGEVYSPGTRLVFGQGSTTREIDLPGGARHVERVEFRYGNLPGGGRAQVEVWGGWARAGRERSQARVNAGGLCSLTTSGRPAYVPFLLVARGPRGARRGRVRGQSWPA